MDTTTAIVNLSTLTDLELMEKMIQAGQALSTIERESRQAMAAFQQRQRMLADQLNVMQTEANIRIAKKNGTQPAPVGDTLSETRRMQQTKNQQEEHRKLFPPASGSGSGPDKETNPPKEIPEKQPTE